MDLKNTLAAVTLSAAVIIIYGLFFAEPPKNQEELLKESYKFKSDTDTEVVAVELSKQWTGDLLETVTKVSKSLEIHLG